MKTFAIRMGLILAFGLLGTHTLTRASENSTILWQIGEEDGDNSEFALAPQRFNEFHEDGFFVVGKSSAKQDWPYAHPGPADAWAGGRQHDFTIVFGLRAVPANGACRLILRLLDAQKSLPPRLKISINGHENYYQPEGGAGDQSIFGNPKAGSARTFDLAVETDWLKAGRNEVTLTTVSGSWALYDCVIFRAPPGTELTTIPDTLIGSASSQPVLVNRAGVLSQLLRFSLRHFGEESEAAVRIVGSEPVPVNLRGTVQTLELAVPAVTKETPTTILVESAGKVLASKELVLHPVRKWVVYLLPHSHVDIGYTHVQTEVERAQWKYLEMGMDAARRSAAYPEGSRFKWNVEVLWAVDSYLQQASPEKRGAFYDAVRAGQVGLDALYGNMLTGLCRPEEMMRLLRMATEMTERTGVPVESAMITDVPGYTWGVVPAFAHSGVKYFSIGPNGGDRIGHTAAAWGDKPFWWIGPNGKDKLLVWMTGTGYYQVFQSTQRLLDYLQRLDARGYAYDYVQVRHCLGDNGAPDVDFADKVRAWNETHAYPRLVIATTAEMFHDFEKRYGETIPVARGDFTPYWEDGAASSARETALNRASAERLVQAEALFATFNRQAYPLRDFYTAWRNVVLYDEHTWGAHNSISEPDHPFVKSQWAIKQANALDADLQSRNLITAANESRGGPVIEPSATRTDIIDVVNTSGFGLPWSLVVVPEELSRAGNAVTYKPGGPKLVSQRLTTGELVFRPCLGSFSAKRFYITDEEPADIKDSLASANATEFSLMAAKSALSQPLKVRLDPQTGAIASLLYGAHEFVDTNASTALNDYFYLPGSDVKGLQRNGPVTISVKEKGPLIASLLVESEAPGCRHLTREIRIHALRNNVEVVNTLEKTAVRAKEGVHFGFAFNVPNGTARLDVPWAIVQPEKDQLRGACKNWFTIQRWVDISNDRHGVTWITPDAPLVELGGLTANLIGSLSNPRSWMDEITPSQTLYSWAMNNHWHTNYRAEQEGTTVFRYFIYPHDKGFSAEDATKRGLECSQPVVVLPARGDLPNPPVLSSNQSVMITALKPSDDSKGVIVRLFALSAQPQTTTLSWADPQPDRLFLSDNSERPRHSCGSTIEIPGNSIVTIRAEWTN